jgi:addiction module RelB/DinJ family antitoxin
MPQDARVQYRINSATKDAAYTVFRDLGITPSEAVRVFFTQVERTKTIPFVLSTASYDQEEKEEGYDEWLRARLETTIKKLDSGEMKTYTHDEAKTVLRERLAKRRSVAALA